MSEANDPTRSIHEFTGNDPSSCQRCGKPRHDSLHDVPVGNREQKADLGLAIVKKQLYSKLAGAKRKKTWGDSRFGIKD